MRVVPITQHRQANNRPVQPIVMPQISNGGAVPLPIQTSQALLSIFVGGLIAGTLDLISAFLTYGWPAPRAVTAGLLGRGALHGGAATYALGVTLHFFIALSAAAIYYAASLRLYFLAEHALVCGVFYGIAIFLVMNLIVLPVSGLHARGPFELTALIRGLLVHMFLIGLPISFSVQRYSR
jgi:hypothetical protein